MYKSKKQNSKEKGITLIALIITIIILLILAGVTINVLIGDNGLFNIAKKASEDYEKAAIEEKVNLALLDYNTRKMINGEETEVENALDELLANGIFSTIEKEYDLGVVNNYEIVLNKVDNEIKIKEIQKEDLGKMKIRYTINPKKYTNEDIKIKINASGNVKKVIMPDKTEKEATNGRIEISYVVTLNGSYTFIVEDDQGVREEKIIEINQIDKLPPKTFTTTIKEVTDTGFKIVSVTEDEDTANNSVSSGIDRYEYYVKKGNEDYILYTNNVMTGLDKGVYEVYTIAYDKAGNKTTSNTAIAVIGGVYIYNYGDECIDLTGGWNETGTAFNGGTTEKYEDHFEIYGTTQRKDIFWNYKIT